MKKFLTVSVILLVLFAGVGSYAIAKTFDTSFAPVVLAESETMLYQDERGDLRVVWYDDYVYATSLCSFKITELDGTTLLDSGLYVEQYRNETYPPDYVLAPFLLCSNQLLAVSSSTKTKINLLQLPLVFRDIEIMGDPYP